MFNHKTKSLLLVAVVLVATAGVGIPAVMAAAPSVDSETTTTAQDSDLTDNSTQTYNTTTASNFSWSADSADSVVKVKQNGTLLTTFSPDHYHTENTTGDSTPETWYFNKSVADDGSDYPGLSADANENVTLTYTIINNTSAANPDTTNVTVYFQNKEVEAFTRADSATVAKGGQFSVSMPWSNDSDDEVKPTKTTKTVDVTKNTSTITFASNQQNLTDALAETHAAAQDSGFTTLGAVYVNGGLVPLFTSSSDVPDWMGNQTYATLDDSGQVTVENLNTSEDTVDVKVVGNERANFYPTFMMLQDYGAGIRTAAGWPEVDGNTNPTWEDATS